MVPKINLVNLSLLVDKRLIHLGEINNIPIKEFLYHPLLTPPLPFSTFIKMNNIFSYSYIYFLGDFFALLWLDIG